jgi:hypothetical protein
MSCNVAIEPNLSHPEEIFVSEKNHIKKLETFYKSRITNQTQILAPATVLVKQRQDERTYSSFQKSAYCKKQSA